MDSFDRKTLDNLGYHISRVESAMLGLSALFKSNDPEFLNRDEMYGISDLVGLIKDDARKVRRAMIDRHLVREFFEFASKSDLKKAQKLGRKIKGKGKR